MMQETPRAAPHAEDGMAGWQMLQQGISFSMLFGIQPAALETLYAYAYQLFITEEFDKAKRYYVILTQMDQWNFDYWFAAGLCCQRLAEHDQAIFCFAQAAAVQPTDPRPTYFAGVSYQVLGNLVYACKAFETSVMLCGSQEEYQALRNLNTTAWAQCGAKEEEKWQGRTQQR